jgi:hypothetical protein
MNKVQRLPTLRSAAVFFGAVWPLLFPELRRLAYVLNRIQLLGEKGNTYTPNGMEKKRNRVTQNTAVTANFKGRRVDHQIVTDLSEKSALMGPFHFEDGSTTLLRNVSPHSVTRHKTWTPPTQLWHPQIGDVLQASLVRLKRRPTVPFSSRHVFRHVFSADVNDDSTDCTYKHNKVPYHHVWNTTVRKPAVQKRDCQHAGLKPLTTHSK